MKIRIKSKKKIKKKLEKACKKLKFEEKKGEISILYEDCWKVYMGKNKIGLWLLPVNQ